MIAGLVFAPLSSPVMAGAPSHASMQAMADEMSPSATTDEMAGDKTRRPSKGPAPVDCDKCVFMAACMSKCFTGMTMALFQPLFAVSAGLVRLQNDFWPDGLASTP